MTRSLLTLALSLSLCAASAPALAQAAPARPNIVVLVADDWGFTDVGAFGGEIATPHIDALARRGVRFSNFHVAASCSPTRSMLLTGVDNHRNGVGNLRETMPRAHLGQPGYQGSLTPQRRHRGQPAAGQRLPHLCGRQMECGLRTLQPAEPARLRPLDRARRHRLGQLGPAASATCRTPPRSTGSRTAQRARMPARVLLVAVFRRPDHRLHRLRCAQRQALLRLCGVPGQPRAGPGAAGLHRQVQGPLRRRLGRAAPAAARQGGKPGTGAARHALHDHGHQHALGRHWATRTAATRHAKWRSTRPWPTRWITMSGAWSTISRRSANTTTPCSCSCPTTAPKARTMPKPRSGWRPSTRRTSTGSAARAPTAFPGRAGPVRRPRR